MSKHTSFLINHRHHLELSQDHEHHHALEWATTLSAPFGSHNHRNCCQRTLNLRCHFLTAILRCHFLAALCVGSLPQNTARTAIAATPQRVAVTAIAPNSCHRQRCRGHIAHFPLRFFPLFFFAHTRALVATPAVVVFTRPHGTAQAPPTKTCNNKTTKDATTTPQASEQPFTSTYDRPTDAKQNKTKITEDTKHAIDISVLVARRSWCANEQAEVPPTAAN